MPIQPRYATIGTTLTVGDIDELGTQIFLNDINGWDGVPGTTGTVEQRITAHGGWPTPAFLTSRSIELAVTLVGSSFPLVTQSLRMMGARLPLDELAPLVVNDHGLELTSEVRLGGEFLLSRNGPTATGSISLVAPDPRKYDTSPLTGQMGVFTGESWFRTYDATPFKRIYDPAGRFRTYEQQAQQSAYPPAVALISPGDAPSSRVLIEVSGPLTRGDWWLLNEATGARIWADVDLVAGQTIVFDNYAQTATLDGNPVDDLVFGDWLTLEPGSNTYRLVSGTQSAGFASLVLALPAYTT